MHAGQGRAILPRPRTCVRHLPQPGQGSASGVASRAFASVSSSANSTILFSGRRIAIIFRRRHQGAPSGMRQYERMMGDFARQYLANMEHIGVPREASFSPTLAKFMEA